MPKKPRGTGWMKPRREGNLEPAENRYYIFSEGTKTEPYYFLGFKKAIEDNPAYRNMVTIKIEPCGMETIRVVNRAEEYVRENHIEKGEIWCVYDKDDFPASHFNEAEQITQRLNQSNSNVQYHAAWSNQCIEFWFLLHFSNYASDNNRPEYYEALDKTFQKIGLKKYEKNIETIFDILWEHGNPRNAIRYAERIISRNKGIAPAAIAPGTMVHELVKELAKYLPDDMRKLFLDK